MLEIKQVIVIRKDLNMRKGKMIAQGAHASIKAILSSMLFHPKETANLDNWYSDIYDSHNENVNTWLRGSQTKICVSVDSEQELFDILNQAIKTDLPCSLILDAGKTEFKEPTYTAVAIGPGSSEEIDKITGKLKLL